MSRVRRGFAIAPPLLAMSAIGVGLNNPRLAPIVNPSIRPVGLEAQDSHAAASLIGQFRTSASSSMFLRADLYLHNGVEMRPLSDSEKSAGRRGVGTSDKPEDRLHDDSLIVTIVPDRSRDFRGVLGDVERATAAYRDMKGHKHNDPTTTLPLFRLMTLLDPQFVPGWTMGAAILARDRSKAGSDRSLTLLREGLESNPQSPEILGAIGKLYLTHYITIDEKHHIHRSLEQARPWYRRAVEVADANRERLTEPELEAAKENARFAAMLERDAGDHAALARILGHGLRLFPDDPILVRMAESAGFRRNP